MSIDDFEGRKRKLETITAKVKFEQGTYWYINPENFEIGDLVYVEGTKEGCLGKIIEIGNLYDNFAAYNIKQKVGHVDFFDALTFANIWSSYKPKDRKEYLKSKDIPETVTKSRFINIMENRWNVECQKGNAWNDFVSKYK